MKIAGTGKTTHRIQLKDNYKIQHYPPQRLGEKQKEAQEKEVIQLIEMGVIRRSSSTWAARMLLVQKPDGSWRPCIDYRGLNTMTVKDSYPLPIIDDVLAKVGTGKVFSKIDLFSGYWQVPIHKPDIQKTAFCTTSGLYEYIYMPMGLRNACATFQRMMEEVLSPVLGKCCLVYLDNIAIYSPNENQHLKDIEEIFNLLRAAGLRMKVEKCSFFSKEMELLGFEITPRGVGPQQSKLKTIEQMKVLPTKTSIKSFLGLVRYYQRFVPCLSEKAVPLQDMLKNESKPDDWNSTHDKAVKEMK